MRLLLAAVIVALAGLVVFNYVTTGELRVIPSRASADEVDLRRLQERFDDARRELKEATRSAGKAGDDVATRTEAARRKLEDVKRDLDQLLAKVQSQAKGTGRKVERGVQDKAKRLRKAVDAFVRELKETPE
jgi:Ribonuclease G/E